MSEPLSNRDVLADLLEWVSRREGEMASETCLACGEPTGRAGKGEDSIYAGDVGPLCAACWADVKLCVETDRDAEIERLRAFIECYSRMDSPHMDGTANYRMSGNIGRGQNLWDAIAARAAGGGDAEAD